MAIDGKVLIEALEITDWRHGDLRPRSYSGRAMFGRDCVGVEVACGVSSFQLAAALCEALLDLDEEEAPGWIADLANTRVCEDSMGRDQIVYFPDVAWPEDVEEDEHDCEGESCCTGTDG
jgi:hypothetical protein